MKPKILSLIFIWYEITSVLIITATITTATAETSTISSTLSSEISSSSHTQQPATSSNLSTSTTTGQEGTTVKQLTSTSYLNTTTEGLKHTTASWWSYQGSTVDSRWLCIYNNGSGNQTTNSTSVMPWWWCRLLAGTTTANLMKTSTPQSLPATKTSEGVALSVVANVVTTARPQTIGSVNITAHPVTSCWWCSTLTTIHPGVFVTTANSFSNVTRQGYREANLAQYSKNLNAYLAMTASLMVMVGVATCFLSLYLSLHNRQLRVLSKLPSHRIDNSTDAV